MITFRKTAAMRAAEHHDEMHRTSESPRRVWSLRPRKGGNRRGISLLLVMVAVSASLIITLSFVRTETSCLRIRHNALRRDLALQAAQTGASVALEAMHSTTWAGVTVPLSRTVLSDSEGTSSFEVEFLPIQDVTSTIPDDAPLYVAIRSTGQWISAEDVNEQVSKQVEVITRLLPRVSGRTIGAGDSASATDVTANPGSYDTIQTYAAYVKTTSEPLQIEPEDRIDGTVWLYDNPRIYGDVLWSSTIRNTMLTSIGQVYGTTSGGASIIHPHPFNGQLTFRAAPSAAIQADLAKLGVTWNQNGTVPTWPSIDYAGRLTYQVFQGGFTYNAVTVGANLSATTYKPTSDNPLGIFYHAGDMNVLTGTNIYGTLVCTGSVNINGYWIHFAAPNWRDTEGDTITWNGDKWPRLPVIVSKHVVIQRDTTVSITGAVVCQNWFQGAGGDFEYAAVTDADISGTATSWPIEQPFSMVQLNGSPNLSGINSTGYYSIWLENGVTGGWHEIIGVDTTLKQLKVVGEVTHSASTNFRIRRTRKRFAEVQGPIAGDKILIKRPLAWQTPTATNWDTINTNWTTLNATRAASSLPPIPFVDYLADPANWTTWSDPIKTYGLPMGPTFHLRNTSGIKYLWTTPMFTPYNGTGPNAPYAGYRWKIISWRQVI